MCQGMKNGVEPIVIEPPATVRKGLHPNPPGLYMKPFSVILQSVIRKSRKEKIMADPVVPTVRMSTTNGLDRRRLLAAGALAIAGVTARPKSARADSNPEISNTEEAIHQERVFSASPKRVYEALTIERQFDRIVRLSSAMKADAMAMMHSPTKLSARVGGAFTLFGGYIVGRQLELVPNELVVQAWRVMNWPRGVYSIARFDLSDRDGKTTLVFDHTAFPRGQATHLASGWQANYWDPLTKLLG
jgi:activator of HSP90 ATPase